MSPKSRILNNTCAVYCMLNQRTQIVIHTTNTYAFVDQNVAVNCFFFKLLCGKLSKTPLTLYRERNSLQNSGCHKSKRLSVFIIFIPL